MDCWFWSLQRFPRLDPKRWRWLRNSPMVKSRPPFGLYLSVWWYRVLCHHWNGEMLIHTCCKIPFLLRLIFHSPKPLFLIPMNNCLGQNKWLQLFYTSSMHPFQLKWYSIAGIFCCLHVKLIINFFLPDKLFDYALSLWVGLSLAVHQLRLQTPSE